MHSEQDTPAQEVYGVLRRKFMEKVKGEPGAPYPLQELPEAVRIEIALAVIESFWPQDIAEWKRMFGKYYGL